MSRFKFSLGCVTTAALLLTAGTTSAQGAVPDIALKAKRLSPHSVQQIATPPARYTYDLETGEVRSAASTPTEAPLSFGFDNTCSNGSFFTPGSGTSHMDWGVYTPVGSETGLMHSFEFGYVTSETTSVAIDIGLWAGTVGTCGAADTASPLANFSFTGLPPSVSGNPEGFIISVPTRTTGLVLPTGAIGWDYEMFETTTGPLLTDGPLGTCANGTIDAYNEYTPPADSAGVCVGNLFFGGCAPVAACASFYLGIVTDDGSTPPAATARFGCSGMGTVGAMTLASGPPSVSGGGTVDFTIDPGVAGIAAGAPALTPAGTLVITWLSSGPDVFGAFPCGTLVSGAIPGFWGELLISIAAPNPIVSAPLGGLLWFGTPVTTSIPVPLNANFVGITLFTQSTMTDFGTTGDTVLTEAWDITIGP